MYLSGSGGARPQRRRECAARKQDGAREIGFYKADIDAAFRRVAIRPDHHAYAWVAYTVGEENWNLRCRAARPRGRAALHALAMADALLGRMTAPVPADAGNDEGRVLTPRFAVVQGCKADGTEQPHAP